MPVTHCLCEGKSFAELIAWARENGATTLEELAAGQGCSTHCGLCGPYLEYALETGRTVVPFPCPILPSLAAGKKSDPVVT
ncbi:MAG: (2Fe-2S)-binding protein [Sumerlaeia bacterium]